MESVNSLIEKLIFNRFQRTMRYTQDSPVYPDVWLAYFNNRKQLRTYRADVILVPHRQSSAPELFQNLLEAKQNADASGEWEMASTRESVVARLTLKELITLALPLTKWWQGYLWDVNKKPTDSQVWIQELVGALYYFQRVLRVGTMASAKLRGVFRKEFQKQFGVLEYSDKKMQVPISLWSVSKNRDAVVCIEKSIAATKADAARRVFDIDGSDIAWAVLDTGIDARHSAFRKTDSRTKAPYAAPMGAKEDRQSNHTRIVATYDFTKFRELLSTLYSAKGKNRSVAVVGKLSSNKYDQRLSPKAINDFAAEVEKDLKNGRFLDWSTIAPLLRIPHNDTEYIPPVHPHGTHIAGIIGAHEHTPTNESEALIGMCPGIDLYDIRVLDAQGAGNEFNILAALQFIRWMNSQQDGLKIHGVNLSFSMFHEVASYACGRTPVCDACERLIAEGTVAVAAAGNLGQTIFQSPEGVQEQGFRMVNITDPGNAELVITVGATHRNRPHTYGVSYFSSKGPTGDGRCKPDIVAPGEKIVSTTLDETTDRMDGTSMAAPHVSGAAALLMAQHRELIGKPQRVKEILCSTATDLGRERYFQGKGMLDVLRALQSV